MTRAGWFCSERSRHVYRNAAGEVRAVIRWTTDGWVSIVPTGEGWSKPTPLALPNATTARARAMMEARMAMTAPTAGEREIMRMALASPCRGRALAPLMPQADAAHLPLFVAANEPRLI